MIKKVFAAAAVTSGLVLAGAGIAAADAGAGAIAAGSPGVISGNVIEVPVHAPINLCGDSVSVIGLLNPSFGTTCMNN